MITSPMCAGVRLRHCLA